MCLGVPGRVIEISKDEGLGLSFGKVQFGGITKDVNLSYTPEVTVGDYVVVHVGFAISRLDEVEAHKVFTYLEKLDALSELNIPEQE
jgi:hydrogenase expression/formation protein HypC